VEDVYKIIINKSRYNVDALFVGKNELMLWKEELMSYCNKKSANKVKNTCRYSLMYLTDKKNKIKNLIFHLCENKFCVIHKFSLPNTKTAYFFFVTKIFFKHT
jgi:hypothetical protein